MGMYDSVSASGLIDTAAGNYVPGQNKSVMNSIVDAGKSIAQVPVDAYKYANDLTNEYIARPLGNQVVGPAANYVSDSLAERDYADAHGGTYPASPEELKAYQSYTAKGQGALAQPPSAADQAAAKGAEVQAGVQSAEQKAADAQAKGFKPVPGALQDPAGHLAALNENRQKGVGDATGNMNIEAPTPPTPAQQQDMKLNQVGQKASFDQNAIPEWYKSDSFNYGLISFGLNLLSGNDLATSFGAAGNAFQSMYGQEKRGIWAQDLTKKGYDPVEIENWVRTGDSKVLTSPEERQSKMIAQQLQMQQLDNAQYTNSPEMRQYALDQDKFERGLKVQGLDMQRARLGMEGARLGLERQKYADKQAAAAQDPEFGITNPEARMVLQQGKKFTDDSSLKRSRMNVAAEAAAEGKRLLAQGKTAEAAARYDQYEESYGKAMQGGLGKINKDDAEEIAGPRAVLDRYGQRVVRAVRGAPTMAEFDRALAAAQGGINTEHTVINDNFQSMYENLAPKIGAARAADAVRFQATGAGIGNWTPRAPVASKENVKFH